MLVYSAEAVSTLYTVLDRHFTERISRSENKSLKLVTKHSGCVYQALQQETYVQGHGLSFLGLLDGAHGKPSLHSRLHED